jgi:retinol dehydrogenase-12
MSSLLSLVFPPAPTLTEKNVPSLAGRVYIVTGAASGMGLELARILYGAGATVYIAARSTARCAGGIEKIRQQARGSKAGRLESMVLDLADLTTLKGAVEGFVGKEQKLHGLFHNAGVMTPPSGSKDELVSCDVSSELAA